MSLESAAAFYEKLEKDTELTAKLKEMTVPQIEMLVKNELGYNFTREEMQQVIFERNPELSDEELEAIVGGASSEEQLLTAAGIILGTVAAAAVIIGIAAAGA
jgi:predicted ribosomally synthesized peptide with nif11-like leader